MSFYFWVTRVRIMQLRLMHYSWILSNPSIKWSILLYKNFPGGALLVFIYKQAYLSLFLFFSSLIEYFLSFKIWSSSYLWHWYEIITADHSCLGKKVLSVWVIDCYLDIYRNGGSQLCTTKFVKFNLMKTLSRLLWTLRLIASSLLCLFAGKYVMSKDTFYIY